MPQDAFNKAMAEVFELDRELLRVVSYSDRSRIIDRMRVLGWSKICDPGQEIGEVGAPEGITGASSCYLPSFRRRLT